MKRTYHTDLRIMHRFGLLDNAIKKNIPKNTLYYWKNSDRKITGSEIFFSDEKTELIKTFLSNQTLLNAAKGLYFIYCTWVSITNNIRGMKTQLRKNMEIIIRTIEDVEPLIGLKRACKWLKISLQQFYRWKRKINCSLSPLDECHKRNPLGISPSELEEVKTVVQNEQYKDYPISAIYYEMMRQGRAFMSLNTFYKYAKLFDNVPNRKLFKTKQKIGIRASKPKEVIHADVCIFRPLDHTKIFIYFIVDNFSRMILGWKISLECKSSIMVENLRKVYTQYSFPKEHPLSILMVDDGSENKGDVNTAIENQEILLNKLIAQKDIQFSNSMVEAVNKLMKYGFLFRQELLDFNHVERYLEIAVEQYNNRFHYALLGLTPHEVFDGAIPDKNLFKEQKQQAKILRIAENKALSCDNCAFTIENKE